MWFFFLIPYTSTHSCRFNWQTYIRLFSKRGIIILYPFIVKPLTNSEFMILQMQYLWFFFWVKIQNNFFLWIFRAILLRGNLSKITSFSNQGLKKWRIPSACLQPLGPAINSCMLKDFHVYGTFLCNIGLFWIIM